MAQKRSRDDTTVDDSTPTKKQLLGNNSVLDAIRLPSDAHSVAADNEDFRIITGTYERILYGINAYWEKKDGLVSHMIHKRERTCDLVNGLE